MSLEAHLIESMTDIVFAKDLNGRYIAGNGAWAHLLGKTVDELTGLTDLDLFPADLAGSFRANDQAMLASGQAQSNEEWVTYPCDCHRRCSQQYLARLLAPHAWDPVLKASNGCQSCCVPADC